MIIIGAGMAGLLAGGMIRDEPVTIYERAPSLPNNHSAVLRFRSSIVGDTLGIEFKKVKMMKAVVPWRNPVADSLAYSQKTNGTATLRSVMTADGSVADRFIAPENLIQLMADRVNGEFVYSADVQPLKFDPEELVISTIPMPALMKLLNYAHVPEFKYVSGFNINCRLGHTDAYVSLYVPNPEYEFNRVSITGNKLTIEFAMPHEHPSMIDKLLEIYEYNDSEVISSFIDDALKMLGMESNHYSDVSVKKQPYAKILPIDEGERRRFIVWASDTYNIYSLGRFATWRPGLLMDDVVDDVRKIRRIMKHGSYESRLA
jgi:hypothetical protein